MRQFHELFAGRGDVYGTYAISKARKTTEKGEKRLGKAKTVTDTEVTKALYDAHINGEQSLGIVPIKLDDTVSWFAIDVDSYADDKLHTRLAQKISRLNLPLVIFRTKSGGAHLFCFLTDTMPAAEAREYAKQFVSALGLPKTTEIFPKQEAISKSDGGSWINLPYFGNTRPCLGLDGETELTLKEFLLLAAEKEVHPSDLGFRQDEIKDRREEQDDDGDHKGAPPCVVTMLRDGIEEGGRDNAMTHIAVYLKRAFPDDWEEMLFEINDNICHPPLDNKEIFRIAKSAQRKDYQYLCKQTPMVGICDKQACLRRKFGIGDGEGDFAMFTIDSIRKIGQENPYYVIFVDGLPIRMNSDDLLNFSRFRKAVFETHDKVIPMIKPVEWSKMIAEAMTSLEKEDAPDEVGTSGAILGFFMDWTASRLITGDVKDRLTDGQPYYDKEKKEIIFRGQDFLAFLRRTQGNRYDDRIVWLVLNEEGAEREHFTVNGRQMALWKFPVREPWFDLHTSEGAF